MDIRLATQVDFEILAEMNHQLISDEGHRSAMSLTDLKTRMSDWLSNDYEAALFIEHNEVVGYALWKQEVDYIYIRQMLIKEAWRNKNIGTTAFDELRKTYWVKQRIRLDVLVGNAVGHDFWRAMGFSDYCVTMEKPAL